MELQVKTWGLNYQVDFFSENIISELLENFSAWGCPVSGSKFLVWAGCMSRVASKGRSTQNQEHDYLNNGVFT